MFYRVEARGPWSAAAPRASELVSSIMPDADHLIPYHVVTEGHCWGATTGGEPTRIEQGDVMVFPHGDSHVMSSEPGLAPRPEDSGTKTPHFPFPVAVGAGGGSSSSLVCGFLACDLRPFNPLLTALPRVLHVRGTEGGWLSRFRDQVIAESHSQGSGAELMLTRLSELMFIEVVRRHVETLGGESASWLAGLRDPCVGRALAALHERPAENWTLADLARETATSRSVLAERFTHFVGEPPMQYLARWRMQLAAQMLARAGSKVAAVAQEVGYESEAAFSRAFKKTVGLPPKAWRLKQTKSL